MAYVRGSSSSNSNNTGISSLQQPSSSFIDVEEARELLHINNNDNYDSTINEFNNMEIRGRSNSNSNWKGDSPKKHLHIFGVDLTSVSPALQFILLAGGLIFFMCLYGYFQELVIYGWFDRKLSIFSTLLHFTCCSVFAHIQRRVTHRNQLSGSHSPSYVKPVPASAAVLPPPAACTGVFWWPVSLLWHRLPVLRMGTASPAVALFYYASIVVVKTISQWTSNLCMTQINYPAKTLFKSASPIVTMCIGVLFMRKSYPITDYVAVTLLVIGLYIFMQGDDEGSPQSTMLGIFYVSISMLGSAGVPMLQEHVLTTYHTHPDDVLYFSFLGSTLIAFIFALFTGELFAGIAFLAQNSSVRIWFIFVAFTTFGFSGAIFGVHLTKHFGALSTAITSTARKGFTLVLSFVMFPERNVVHSQNIMGSVVFFAGLLLRLVGKQKWHSKGGSSGSSSGNSDTVVDAATGTCRSGTTATELELVEGGGGSSILLRDNNNNNNNIRTNADTHADTHTDTVVGRSAVGRSPNRTTSSGRGAIGGGGGGDDDMGRIWDTPLSNDSPYYHRKDTSSPYYQSRERGGEVSSISASAAPAPAAAVAAYSPVAAYDDPIERLVPSRGSGAKKTIGGGIGEIGRGSAGIRAGAEDSEDSEEKKQVEEGPMVIITNQTTTTTTHMNTHMSGGGGLVLSDSRLDFSDFGGDRMDLAAVMMSTDERDDFTTNNTNNTYTNTINASSTSTTYRDTGGDIDGGLSLYVNEEQQPIDVHVVGRVGGRVDSGSGVAAAATAAVIASTAPASSTDISKRPVDTFSSNGSVNRSVSSALKFSAEYIL